MANLVRYKANFRGIKELRGSREVDEELEQRANRVAAMAESFYGQIAAGLKTLPPAEDVKFEVLQESSDTREPRARVAVLMRHARGLRIEQDTGVLRASIGAAG